MADALNGSNHRTKATSGLPATIKTDEGQVHMTDQHGDGSLHVEIQLADAGSPRSCETTFPLEVIEFLVGRIGCSRLADFINRFEGKGVLGILKSQLFSYFRPEEFRGKRLLDFGCGAGASTFGLAKLLPETEIVGVDLVPESIEIAQSIASLQGVRNARFLCSPSGDRIPDGIGQFDFVMLCAVYEHLLPRERRTLMPLLWSVMKEGRAIFINQTPYRYFPFEHHSTGLWFINYMPDRVAHFVARKFSKHDPSKYDRTIQKSPHWEDHLRGGLRGATEWEIIRNLTRESTFKARILQPRAECARDRADYWLLKTGHKRFRFFKRAMASTFRITDKFLGTVPSMNVNVVMRKDAQVKAGS